MANVILRQVYDYDEEIQTREWPVPSGTMANTAVLSAGNEPGVTITNRGDATITKTIGPLTITIPAGGVGNRLDSATVATGGSWSGPVTGADGTQPKGTLVYAVVSSGAVTGLTLTATSNTKFGVVDSYIGKGTSLQTAIKIGVFA